MNHFDTVVIGGGQAGLAIGYYLAQQDRDFVIVDACDQVGDAWRHRWDSLRLFSSYRYSSLPGIPFPESDDGFPTKDEMADYLETYAARFDLPVRRNTKVELLTRNDPHYVLDAGSRCFTADHVVVATGPFHHPNIPAFAENLDPKITQLHSREYRNPGQFPDGDILVVGAGNSGTEIAVELATKRRIWLSGPDTGRIPLGFFNTQVFWWLFGRVLTVDTWIGRKLKERTREQGDPLVRRTSTDSHSANIERVPRTIGVEDGKPLLKDGRVIDVAGVVWATGFHPDFSWIELSGIILDKNGYPDHERGVVDEEPGLYFLGLPYQYTLVSATVGGVGNDARYIADHIANLTDSKDTFARI
jgi:putative flavoprotein involved in K+ transport